MEQKHTKEEILSILPLATLIALASSPFFLRAIKLSHTYHEKSLDLLQPMFLL